MKRTLLLLLIASILLSSCAVLDGSGITNYIPKYYSETSIGISSLTDNGTDLSVPAGYKIDGVDISTLGGGSTNLTGTGTANTITKWTGATSIGDSSVTEAQLAASVALAHTRQHLITSTLDHISTATPSQILMADANGLPVNATNSNAQVAGAVSSSHTQNTDTILTTNGITALINGGTLKNNLAVDPGITVDGVDISTLTSSGNVTVTTGIVNRVPVYTSSTQINNSTMTDNGTTISTSSNITTSQLVEGWQIVSKATGGTPPFVVNSGQVVGNLNVDQVDGIEGADILKKDGTVAMTGNLNMGTSGNITLSAGMTVDGIDISAWASSANVSGSGTLNTITKWTGASTINNSSITDNGTTVNVSANITLPAGYTVDGIDISTLTSSGNVTVTTGVANKIPVFSGATSVINSQITDNTTWIATTGNIQTNNVTATNLTVSNNITVSGNITATQNITAKQFVSSVATGTPPLVVTSTTNVTNLNADLLDGNHASAFATTSSANVTSSTGTTNTIPKFSGATGLANSSITDNGTWISTSENITVGRVQATSANITGDVYISGNTTMPNAGYMISPKINENVALSANSTYLNLTDDIDFLTTLTRRYRYSYMPSVNAGTSVTGSGSGSSEGSWIEMATGNTALSKCGKFLTTSIFWSHSASSYRVNWNNDIVYLFTVRRNFTSDANVISRVQIKDSQAIGALAEKGIGLRIENYKLYGESYGASGLASVDLGTTMTAVTPYEIMVVFTSGSSVKWYVEGVLKGTQSTAGNIPTGEGSATGSFMYSIEANQINTNSVVWVGLCLIGVGK